MIKRLKTNSIVVFDLEMCCWDDGRKPNTGEIIEIGVCQVDTKNLTITKVAQYYVKPERDEVSEFCTSLTGITPRTIAKQGRPLREVMATLDKHFGSSGKIFAAWGQDDAVLKEELKKKGVKFVMGDYMNVANMARLLLGESRKSQLDVMSEFGLEFEGSVHSGVDDAKNLARLLIEIMKKLRQ